MERRSASAGHEIPSPARGTRWKIAEELRRRIRGGEFPQGQRLPSERELAVEMASSRATVREALRVLKNEGFVTTTRGRSGGYFVTDLVLPQELWCERMRENPRELDELFDFRIALETRTALLAATRRDEEDLTAMLDSIHLLENRDALSAAPFQVVFRQADAKFHEAIAVASRNDRLAQGVRIARGDIFFPFDCLPHPVYVTPTLEAHSSILQAIRAQNPRAAAAAMEAHLERTRVELGTIILMMTGRMSDGTEA